MKRVLYSLFILTLVVSLNSCGKKDPMKALLGTWETTYGGNAASFSFTEAGGFTIDLGEQQLSGKFSLSEDGKGITFTREDGSESKMEILSLKGDEMKAKDEDGEYTFTKKKE